MRGKPACLRSLYFFISFVLKDHHDFQSNISLAKKKKEILYTLNDHYHHLSTPFKGSFQSSRVLRNQFLIRAIY